MRSTIEQARAVVHGLPPFVTITALFVDAEADYVRSVCNALPIGMLQFHGSEDEAFCRAFARPWMKALRVADDSDVSAMMNEYKDATAILLDTYRPGTPGGTGESFDWQRAPAATEIPLVLAGGLHAGNVGDAIRAVKPYAVDVSGGVESAVGIKDPQRIIDFVAAVRTADENG